MYMFAPVWMKSTMCEWKSVSPDCKMGVCMTNTGTIVLRLRRRRTKKDRLRSRLSKTMKRKMSKGFAVPLYEGGGFFIGLQHLVQQGIQQSAVRRIVMPGTPPQPETVTVHAGEGSSRQGNAGAVRDGWFPLCLSCFLSHRLLRGG